MKKKSYFAQSVLHTAGQSLQTQIRGLTFRIGIFAGIAICLLIAISIIFKFLPIGALLVVAIVSLIGIMCDTSKFNKYFQGLEGERRTREEIEPIIKDGYHILNDVPGNKFNIDFLIIGPSGIYAIEVKNPRKHSDDEITYKDKMIFLGDKPLKKHNPVKEAQNHAKWVKVYLRDITGENINNIKPVVLFPNIMVTNDSHCVLSDIWILNPKRFRDYYLPKQNKVLEPREVQELVKIFRARIYDCTPKFED